MDISYNDLRNKEIINLCDGTKMGHTIDVVFDSESGKVTGLVAPGEKRLFKKADEIFIPLEKIRRIGDDVILVKFEFTESFYNRFRKNEKKITMMEASNNYQVPMSQNNGSFIRYRRLDNKKYK